MPEINLALAGSVNLTHHEMPTRLDPLEYLEREDKWFLGGGKAAMFAPAFPRFLKEFGFWDEAYFADVRLERLFTVLVLDENGRPLDFSRDNRRWTPDALTQTYSGPDGLRIREDKVVTPHDVLASRLAIFNEGKRDRTLHLILWSLQDHSFLKPGIGGTSAEHPTRTGDFLTFAHAVEFGDRPYADRPAENAGWGERGVSPLNGSSGHSLCVALGADLAPVSHAIALSERSDTSPLWEISIVPEWFRDGTLIKASSSAKKQPGSSSTTSSSTIIGAGDSHLHLCLHYSIEVPSGANRAIQFGAALSLDRERALFHVQNDLQQDVAAMSRASWRKYFDSVPYFECSDPYLQKYYWYRWYGLRLLTVDLSEWERGRGGEGEMGREAGSVPEQPTFELPIPDTENSNLNAQHSTLNTQYSNHGIGIRITHPCVFEGIGGFRSHISYSAQCHMFETSWMHDPRLAMGCLEGLLAAQENSGFIPGHLYLWREDRGFYLANWGAAALQVYHISGDTAFLERVYPGLSRYAEYFERERDREDSHLYDIVDQGETGQEYMSRYLFADESADDWRRIQLKGVDATVYVYSLQRSLAEMARELGRHPEAEVWDRKADATREAVREKMWDSDLGLFFDVHPKSGLRSPFKAAVGFYPFMTDIATKEHLRALTDHLLNPSEFWTEYPVPASSIDDPYFNAEGEWKGRRMSCPWNGRSWPMATSHACEALAHASLTLDPALKPHAVELIRRFVTTMFWNGDPRLPNCFEHYNPFTGSPSAYRGIDDYQHSWVVDLLIKYLGGLQPNGSDQIVLDPLPFNVDRFLFQGIDYRGHAIDISWDESEGYAISVDGVELIRRAGRERMVISL